MNGGGRLGNSATPAGRPGRARRSPVAPGSLLILGLALLVVAVVQRRALSSFFAPDDCLHMEQALGILPTPAMIWRILSQVVYFRVMLKLFGAVPAPFMAVNLAVHLANCGLLFLVARRQGGSRTAATLAVIVFGACPLFVTVLHRAVTLNDSLALTCWLLAWWVLQRRARGSTPVAAALFVLGLLSKESILAMPFLLWIVPPFEDRRPVAQDAAAPGVAPPEPARPRPALASRLALPAISVIAAVAFFAIQPSSSGTPYAIAPGMNVVRNLATYLSWFVSVWTTLPDRVGAWDPAAWRVAVPAVVVLAGAWLAARRDRGRVRSLLMFGTGWWVLGLLPVLLLANRAYGHYAYAASAGLAVALATAIEALTGAAVSRSRPRLRRLAVPAVAGAIAAAYAIQANATIDHRLHAMVEHSDLLLDPFLRGIQVERNVGESLRGNLTPATRDLVFFSPTGASRTFGARSGREYPEVRDQGYDLVEALSDSGRVARVFLPGVTRVAYVHDWSNAYLDREVFVPVGAGFMWHAGTGAAAAIAIAELMTRYHWSRPAPAFLERVLVRYPDEPRLRFAYSVALLRSGRPDAALAQLAVIERTAPDDSIGRLAHAILVGAGRYDSAAASDSSSRR